MGLKPVKEQVNPFPGLRPFLPEDSFVYFGSESESGEVLRKLLKNRILTVIGSSGCGKSSLINCGVVPEMMNMAEKEKTSLKIISFQPGNDPVGNMTNAFVQAIIGNSKYDNHDNQAVSNLKRDHDWIASTVKKLLIKSDEKVLIVIDQFEELFTHTQDETTNSSFEKTSEFVSLLENAIRQTSVEIYILIVIRSEYISECSNIQGLTKLINDSNYLVPQMTRGNYKNVFENSFLSAGTRINPNLVVAVLDDISDLTDPLPVLQHLMMRIYSYWLSRGDTGKPVELSDYVAVGTIGSALSRHADEAYDELSQDAREICRKMFRAMAGDRISKKGTRHPLSVSSLKSILQCSEVEIFEVIEKFRTPSRSFLTPRYGIPLDENSVIEFSTDNLISMWSRLKGWFEEELSSVRTYRQLSEASEMYQKGKATLLKDTDLQLALNWRDNQKPTLSWAKRYDPAFERVMVYLRTSEKAFLEREVTRSGAQNKKIRRNRITALIFGGIVVVSFGLMLLAFAQKFISDRQRSESEHEKAMAISKLTIAEQNAILANKRIAQADSNAVSAARKEIEALQEKEIYNIQKSVAERKASEARRQLTRAMELTDSAKNEAKTADLKAMDAINQKNEAQRMKMILLGKSMSLKSLQLTDQKDLQALLAYQAYKFNKSNGGSPYDPDIYSGLYNAARLNGKFNSKTFAGHEGEIRHIAFVPGKNEFFTSGMDGKVIKWDLNGKNQSLQVVYSGSDIINVLAVSPDAGWLACGGQNSGIRMVPIKGNDLSYELKGHTGPVKSLIFSFDGRYLYSSSLDGKVLKWDIKTRSATNIAGSMMEITSIDLSTDNKYIAGVTNDGKVNVWNPDVTSDNFRIESPGKAIRTVKFKPEENILAIGYTDGYIEFWDISSRKKISDTRIQNSEVTNICFNKRLSQMATAGTDKSIRIWDLTDRGSLPVAFNDNEGLVFAIEFSPDGQVLVSGTSEGRNNLISRPVLADILAKDMCTVIARNFTSEEWLTYVGKDVEYEKTCPEAEFKIKISAVK
jgi:WD40 repeat protein